MLISYLGINMKVPNLKLGSLVALNSRIQDVFVTRYVIDIFCLNVLYLSTAFDVLNNSKAIYTVLARRTAGFPSGRFCLRC